MNKTIQKITSIFSIPAILILLALYFYTNNHITKNTMQIISPSFNNNEQIPSKYTCDGLNINPPLEIKEIPQNTKSIALILDDPDAPTATFTHWTVWNIDPTTTKINENQTPQNSTEGITDFKTTGYGGPCPPQGTHRYHFKLYALDTKLQLQKGATKQQLEAEIKKSLIEKAELIGLYKRK